MHRLFDAQRVFSDSAQPDEARGPTLIRWLRGPHYDSPCDIQAAREALVGVGYRPSEANRALMLYLRQVRAALTTPGYAALAGLLTVTTMAAGVLLMLILALEVPVRRWGLGGDLASDYRWADTPLLPNIMPEAALGLLLLGLAGAGMALVICQRWRRAGVLYAFSRQAPPRIALPVGLGAAGLLLLVAGLTVLVGWWLIWLGLVGEATQLLRLEVVVRGPLVSTRGQALIFAGIPLGAAAYAAWFPGLFAWILRRTSPVDSAAYARPLVAREAARQTAAAREIYSRSAYRWADHVTRAARQRSVEASRTPDTPTPRVVQKPGALRRAVRLWRSLGWGAPLLRLGRYGLLTGGVTVVVWRLFHFLVWYFRPDAFGRYGQLLRGSGHLRWPQLRWPQCSRGGRRRPGGRIGTGLGRPAWPAGWTGAGRRPRLGVCPSLREPIGVRARLGRLQPRSVPAS